MTIHPPRPSQRAGGLESDNRLQKEGRRGDCPSRCILFSPHRQGDDHEWVRLNENDEKIQDSIGPLHPKRSRSPEEPQQPVSDSSSHGRVCEGSCPADKRWILMETQ